jgi:acetyl esterase/lipase
MRWLLPFVLLAIATPCVTAADSPSRQSDIVYGRKHGMALTMDVFTPTENANGAALVFVVSGGWVSAHEGIRPEFVAPFVKRGYTVFAVVHGSQPKFTIPECIADVKRSIRFIRHNAERFNINPDRIGIMGASAGGHLSLSLGTMGDDGDANAKDEVERKSSRVQAVACFFPPTDFLNYGKPGEEALGNGVLAGFKAPFDFSELSPQTKRYERITDEERRRQIGKLISPVYHVTADDAPSLIIHGDADKLVPIQQAELIIEKFKSANVPCELVVKANAGHGWPTIGADLETLADWFDKHLAKK